MQIFKMTEDFAAWLSGLKDRQARAQVARRVNRACSGNFGDVKPVGEGVSEMRIHVGPGYRVYLAREDSVVYVLLSGGNKSSQQRDIAHAKSLWAEIKRSKDK